MKKTYIEPSVQVVSMHVTSIIAFSDGKQSLGDARTYDGGGTISGVKTNNYNVWDEDWNK